MEQFNRICATIDLDAIRYNIENMKANLQPGPQMIAVVKSDGYGHGALPIAREIEELDYLFGYGVATFEEAMILRQGGIRKPIIILGYTFPECYGQMAEQEIRPAVFRRDMLPALSQAAAKTGKKIKVHIKVDTGMSRIGVQTDEDGLSFVQECLETPGIEAEGIFTHFARADEIDKTAAAEQLRSFIRFLQKLEDRTGVRIPIRHCSNSAGIIEMKEANLDAVRAGVALYGMWPSEEVDQTTVSLRPTLTLTSHIIYIKELSAGRQISYGGTYETREPVRVATIPVGYGDGYPRSLSNLGYVLIRGRKAPVLGRVCMDQMMVDVSGIPEAAEDDPVILIGRDGTEEITMEALGNLSGRFNYELACCLNRRVPRIYVKNGEVVFVHNNIREYM